jgi:phosphoribosylformylglycinamidine synthase
MAMAGGIGANLAGLDKADAGVLFGEDQGRYVLAVRPEKAAIVQERAKTTGVPVTVLGKTSGTALTGRGPEAISIERLRKANESWLPGYMMAEA